MYGSVCESHFETESPPYDCSSRAREIRACWVRCQEMIDSAVDRLDLSAPDSGFPWYKMSKLEHQFVNLRHLQHHTGQLAERIRQVTGRGIRWAGGSDV